MVVVDNQSMRNVCVVDNRHFPKVRNCHGNMFRHFEWGHNLKHCKGNATFMAKELAEAGILESFLTNCYPQRFVRVWR